MLQKQSVNYNTTDQRKCMACSVRLTKIPTTTPSFRDKKKTYLKNELWTPSSVFALLSSQV